MSFTISTRSWAQSDLTCIENPPVSLNLELPLGTIIKIEGKEYLAYNLEQYKVLLKIYVGYDLWAKDYCKRKDLEAKFNAQLKLCEDKYQLQLDAYNLLKDDRNLAYNLLNEEIERNSKEKRLAKIKTVLFTSGGIIVGIGIGALLGFFATK